MDIQQLQLNELRPNDSNPRSITTEKFEKLVDNILCFPSMLNLRPIVVDKDNVVLGGNMRTKALSFISGLGYGQIVARLNGLDSFMAIHETKGEAVFDFWRDWLADPKAPVVRADSLTEEEKRQFIILDNVPFGQWDYDILANEWDETLLQDFGLDLPWLEGMDNEENATEDGPQGGEGENPGSEGCRCKPGDVWKLGVHLLECGDTDLYMCDTLVTTWEQLTGKKATLINKQ